MSPEERFALLQALRVLEIHVEDALKRFRQDRMGPDLRVNIMAIHDQFDVLKRFIDPVKPDGGES